MDIDLKRYTVADKMTTDLWSQVKFFTAGENWGDPLQVSVHLIYHLDALREYIDRPIFVYCAYEYEGHLKGSVHKFGLAVDCAVKKTSNYNYKQFFLDALRFPFNGVGMYPFWKPHAGLHLDVRNVGELSYHGYRNLWWRDSQMVYQPIVWESMP